MNQAFIDGQNLNIGTTRDAEKPWQVDLRKFRIYLREKYGVELAYYFIGAFDPRYQGLYSRLQAYGYILVFREHVGSVLSHKKGNVDTDIVFEIMKKVHEDEDLDKVVLVSGDGDYWRMVDYLISIGRFEKLLAPNHKAISSLYKRTPDRFRDYLDNPSVKRKIFLKNCY